MSTNGLWACSGLPVGLNVRVEFKAPAQYEPAKPGVNNGLDVQFVSIGDCQVDFGVFETKNFMDPNPWMIIPCYTKGNPLIHGSPVVNEPTILANRYNTPDGGREIKGPGGNYYVASASETGMVWGVAYQPETKTLFRSAFLRRHAMYGPGGLGAISRTNLSAFLANPEANAPSYQTYGQTSILLNLDN
jgi:trimeric autotransporter adhesin